MGVLNYGKAFERKYFNVKHLLLLSVLTMVALAPWAKSAVKRAIANFHAAAIWKKCLNNEVTSEIITFTDDPAVYRKMNGGPEFQDSDVGSWHFCQYVGRPWINKVRNHLGVAFLGPVSNTLRIRGVAFLGYDQRGGDLSDERLLYVYGTWLQTPADVETKRRALCLRLFSTKEDRITIHAGHRVGDSSVVVPVSVNGQWHEIRILVLVDDLRIDVDGDTTTDANGMHDWHTEEDTRLRNAVRNANSPN